MKNVQLKDTQRKAYDSDLKSLSDRQKATHAMLDKWAPTIIGAVIAGNHVSLYNRLVKACNSKGNRPTDLSRAVFAFGKAHLPHQFDEEKFTFSSKLPARAATATLKRFEAFQASGMTFSQWCESRHEKAPPVDIDPREQFRKSCQRAVKKGIPVADAMAIMREVFAKAPAAEKKAA